MGSYTAQEAVLASIVALLTLYELSGVVVARLSGRSKNLSRMISKGLMLLLLGPWVGYTFYWVKVMEAPGVTSETFGSSALNLPYLLLGIGLLVIAVFEILGLYRARQAGFTSNTSRLVTHTLIVALVLTMVSLSILEWNHYMTDEEHSRLPTSSLGASSHGASARGVT